MGNELADKLADEGAREETPCVSKPRRPEGGGFCEVRRNYPTRFTAGKNDGAVLFGDNTIIEAAENANMDSGMSTRGRTRKFVDLVENDGIEEVRERAGTVPTIYEMQGAIAEAARRCGKQKKAYSERSCLDITLRRWTLRNR